MMGLSLLIVLSIVGDWLGKQIGWLSYIPGFVFILQGLLSLLLLIFTFGGVLLLPGWKLKLLSLFVGFGVILVVWFI